MSGLEEAFPDVSPESQGSGSIIPRALRIVRAHLGMEIAYLSEFCDGRSVFRAVDTPGFEKVAYPGGSMLMEEVYCQHILDGRLPELIPDTSKEPLAAAMPITSTLPIGAHVSVPIRRPDGTPFGMFCCLSRTPNPSLNGRDLEIMRVFADLAAGEIRTMLAERERLAAIEARISSALADGFGVVYQPIMDLRQRRLAGFEALCRFTGPPYRSPDIWFAEAAEIGKHVELELGVIARALEALRHLPEPCYVSVNASPEAVARGALYDIFKPFGFDRILLEVTEHAAVADYSVLERALSPLRFAGVRLAIDDAGAGYSGLQHILRLRPDVLKLDLTLTRNIDADFARRSLAAALVHFANETQAAIVAEGIETEGELAALRALGVPFGQGYHLGRPMALDAALDRFGISPRDRSA